MRIACPVALSLSLSPAAAAGIVSVAPFSGEFSDPLNYPSTTIASSFDIFGGAARLHSFDDQSTTIHLLISSTLGGDPVTPHTGGRILGFTQGPGIFEFEEPALRFGAYWNNNSGADDAMVEFFDTEGRPIGTQIADVPAAGNVWAWNGWESDVPIGSIRVTGFGVIDGFLWFDDLQMSTVPAPGALSVAAGFAVLGVSTRKRRRPDPAASHLRHLAPTGVRESSAGCARRSRRA